MPDAPTPLDLDAIRARANAATEGPWTVTQDKCWGETYPSLSIQRVYEYTDYDPARAGCEPLDAEEVEFIAAARTDVPALIAEVERLRAEVERLRAAHDLIRTLPYVGADLRETVEAFASMMDAEPAREHLPVKPDREAVARVLDPDAWLTPEEWAEEYGCAPDWPGESQRASLAWADAVLDLFPGRSEAEVKREGAVEALRAYAADLNLHWAVEDGWEKYGDDLCGDHPDPCLFWDMTHAEQKRINDRADRLAAEGGVDRG